MTSPESSTGSRPCLAGVPAGKHTHVPREGLAALQGVHAHPRSHTGSRLARRVLHQWHTLPEALWTPPAAPARWSRRRQAQRAAGNQASAAPRSLLAALPAAPAAPARTPCCTCASPAQDPPQPGALACSARLGRCTVMLSRQVSGARSLP